MIDKPLKILRKKKVRIDNFVIWLYTRQSNIDNIGLFTESNIKKGQRIYFNATEITEATYLLLNKTLPGKEKEMFLTTDDKFYDLRDSLLRFMNHSENQNIDWENGLNIYALREIQSGEELTINYGWDIYKW